MLWQRLGEAAETLPSGATLDPVINSWDGYDYNVRICGETEKIKEVQ
jgi:hypothetical protein